MAPRSVDRDNSGPLPEKIGNLLQETRWLALGALGLFMSMAFWGYNMTYNVEPGDFKLWVGTNSAEGLSADFTVSAL